MCVWVLQLPEPNEFVPLRGRWLCPMHAHLRSLCGPSPLVCITASSPPLPLATLLCTNLCNARTRSPAVCVGEVPGAVHAR